MGKVLTAIVVEEMAWLLEIEHLLPNTHFGGWAGHKMTDAIFLLESRVKAAWREGKVALVLFLDIEGAFLNAVTERLLHNMRRCRIPTDYIDFVHILLTGRSTRLWMDGFTSDPIKLDNGIGQGDPLSMILYIIYNSDLLTITDGPDKLAIGYVDDTMIIAIGDTLEETTDALQNIMECNGGGFDWSNDHNSRFKLSKLAVLHCTPRKVADDSYPVLQLRDAVITRVAEYKYLGILVNQHLNWKSQLAHSVAKAKAWLLQVRRYTRPSTGLSAVYMCHLYISVAIPKITYGLEAWYMPPFLPEGKRVRRGNVKALTELSKLQQIATLSISGALHSTATDLLDGHTNILPMEQTLKKVCYRSILWLSALPNTNPAAKLLRRLHTHPEATDLTSLQHHLNIFHVNPRTTERLSIPPRRPITLVKVHLEDSELFQHIDMAEYRVFTDGACSKTHTGTAPVLYKADVQMPIKHIRYRLGDAGSYGVKEAELVGCLLGVSLIQQIEGVLRTPVSLYTDSQAALRHLANPKARSGYHLVSKFYDIATQAAERFAIVGCTPQINM
jgi:hypothetical protein